MKKIYLKFLRNKYCNRTKEIKILTEHFHVEKMPLVIFPRNTEENASIYELIFKEGVDQKELENIEKYFYKNAAVKEITEEMVNDYLNPDFIYESDIRKQEEIERKALLAQQKKQGK